MSVRITGKEVKATGAIEEYLKKKLERINKYFEEEPEVTLTIKVVRSEQIAEISVSTLHGVYRAVTADKDLYASIDKDMDILEGQIRKFKTKRDKQVKEETIKQKIIATPIEVENEIIKSLYYELKPLYPEDAKLKLQEKPENQFLAFINLETNKVNVIYKLKDSKNYGLVEPED